MKTCFKCGTEKPLSEFYKHKQMGDGHLGKCKECTKDDVRNHREENIEKVRAYDRSRGNLPHRVAARKEYSMTPNGIAAAMRSQIKQRKEHPEKYKAHGKVSNSIRDGRLIRPDKCSVCGMGCKPHAHHWSYDEEHWLDVEWVCVNCHIDIHCERREF